MLNAIIFLHENDMYHCDIKPANLFFINNTLKLADFGLIGNKFFPSRLCQSYDLESPQRLLQEARKLTVPPRRQESILSRESKYTNLMNQAPTLQIRKDYEDELTNLRSGYKLVNDVFTDLQDKLVTISEYFAFHMNQYPIPMFEDIWAAGATILSAFTGSSIVTKVVPEIKTFYPDLPLKFCRQISQYLIALAKLYDENGREKGNPNYLRRIPGLVGDMKLNDGDMKLNDFLLGTFCLIQEERKFNFEIPLFKALPQTGTIKYLEKPVIDARIMVSEPFQIVLKATATAMMKENFTDHEFAFIMLNTFELMIFAIHEHTRRKRPVNDDEIYYIGTQCVITSLSITPKMDSPGVKNAMIGLVQTRAPRSTMSEKLSNTDEMIVCSVNGILQPTALPTEFLRRYATRQNFRTSLLDFMLAYAENMVTMVRGDLTYTDLMEIPSDPIQADLPPQPQEAVLPPLQPQAAALPPLPSLPPLQPPQEAVLPPLQPPPPAVLAPTAMDRVLDGPREVSVLPQPTVRVEEKRLPGEVDEFGEYEDEDDGRLIGEEDDQMFDVGWNQMQQMGTGDDDYLMTVIGGDLEAASNMADLQRRMQRANQDKTMQFKAAVRFILFRKSDDLKISRQESADIRETISRVENVEFLNPTAYVFGYLVIGPNNKIDMNRFKKLSRDAPEFDIKPEDIIRYGRLWERLRRR
jgi:serine/threonine protein kinase